MKPRKNREINIFSVSFLDVLANTIGGLAFLLIFSMLMVGAITFIPPSITTEVLPEAYRGQEYATWLAAREGMGKFAWRMGEGKLPPGLALDPASGKLSGTPDLPEGAEESCQYDFTVQCAATDEQSGQRSVVDTRRFSMTVHRAAPLEPFPLQITSQSPLPAAYRGQPYTLAFAAEGGQPPYRWAARGTLPEGMSVQPEGTLAGIPTATGKYTFEVGVITPHKERQVKTFEVTVSEKYPPPPPIPALKVLTRSLPDAVAQREYRILPAAQGGTAPYSWQITRGQPGWLNRDSGSAGFRGTPGIDDIAVGEVVLQVSDAAGMSAASEPMKLEVLPPVGRKPLPLAIKTRWLPDARVGEDYHLAIGVQGGIPPYVWTLATPLPGGGIRFLEKEGVFEGRPEAPATLDASLSVADSLGATASSRLSLRIRPPLHPVRILTAAAATGRVSEKYDLALAATGGFPPYRWRLAAGSLPPGLQLLEEEGRIAGTPSEAGAWQAAVAVTDAQGEVAEKPAPLDFLVLTERGYTRLVVKTLALPTLLAGHPHELALACEGGHPPYKWTILDGGPPGVSVEKAVLQGTPVAPGDHDTQFEVRDSSGQRTQVSIPISVRSKLPAWLVYLLAVLLLVMTGVTAWLVKLLRRRPTQPLEINTRSLPNARASCDYAVQLACIGGNPPYRWAVVAGALPPGLELREDGLLTGCPLQGVGIDETKDFPLTVEVRDADGKTATQQL